MILGSHTARPGGQSEYIAKVSVIRMNKIKIKVTDKPKAM
jgi:hypothetical protein